MLENNPLIWQEVKGYLIAFAPPIISIAFALTLIFTSDLAKIENDYEIPPPKTGD